MLKRLADLPKGIDAVRATGKITREDYDEVMRPLLQEARRDGRRVRLLYHFGPEFESFTPSAAWEDVRIGLQYLRLFERCAVVSDMASIRESSRFIGSMMPCPFRVFANGEWGAALDWLGVAIPPRLTHRFMPESGVLVVQPTGRLQAPDFDAIALTIDPWIESHGPLHGLVIHMRKFPGWENFGGFVRHVQFVRDHHHSVRRIALATDVHIPQLAPELAKHFVHAELEHFGHDELDQAIAWAAARTQRKAPVSGLHPR